MRYRLMATYGGSPFEAGIGPTDDDIVLFAACPPPEYLGFEPATGHWRKQLRFSDVQAVWESRPVGTFRGERCMVLDDLGDRLHIGYLGHDGYKAAELGYWQVDRGVFELVAPRSEVGDIVEERTEYAHQADRTDVSGQPQPPRGPVGQPKTVSQDLPSSPVYPVERRPDSAAYTIPTLPAAGPRPASGPRAAGPQAAAPQAAAPQAAGSQAAAPQAAAPQAAASQAVGYQDFGPGFGAEPEPYRSVSVRDDATGVALPIPAEAPLPLEAEALRATSASRRPRQTAAQRGPAVPTGQQPSTAPAATAAPSRQRRTARARMATERLFADLAGLAGIPADSYAVGEEVEGALCLVQTEDGFEVFHSAGGARHELQVFATEESACFYLFGLLAAEAVRNGTLARVPTGWLA